MMGIYQTYNSVPYAWFLPYIWPNDSDSINQTYTNIFQYNFQTYNISGHLPGIYRYMSGILHRLSYLVYTMASQPLRIPGECFMTFDSRIWYSVLRRCMKRYSNIRILPHNMKNVWSLIKYILVYTVNIKNNSTWYIPVHTSTYQDIYHVLAHTSTYQYILAYTKLSLSFRQNDQHIWYPT